MIVAHMIRARLDELATAITDRQFAAHPELLQRYPSHVRARCLEDARFHLQYLATALEAGNPATFLEYAAWTKIVLGKRGIPVSDIIDNFSVTASALTDTLGGAALEAVNYLLAANENLPSMPGDVPSHLDPRSPLWTVAMQYLDALLRGSRQEAAQIVLNALDAGASLREIYLQVFECVLQEIGRLWQLNQISVAQEHFCTAATQHVMAQLYSRIFSGSRNGRRAVGICVGGELHEVGLRIITDLLELNGWQTWYLGANVPPLSAVQLCVAQSADVLLVSATLPPHLTAVAETVRLFRSHPELSQAKVIVGGRAFRSAPETWRTIGADGYAANADECLALVDRLTA